MSLYISFLPNASTPFLASPSSSAFAKTSSSSFIPSNRCLLGNATRFRHHPPPDTTPSPRRSPPTSCSQNNDKNKSETNGKQNEDTDPSSDAGLTISRRQAIQLLNGVLGIATLGLLGKMREQFRLMSPITILSAFGVSVLPSRTGAGRAAAAAAAAATTTPGATSSLLPATSPERVREARQYLDRVVSGPRFRCPDFPRGADWVNSRPLRLGSGGELKGKLILLDFFTYCCVNCQHVLPRLSALEEKYGRDGSGGFVVVGVHSAKFSAERDTANIAAAVERYEVKHPVINDSDLVLWNALGVSSWPTLALVGPDGNIVALWSGERQESDIDAVVTAAMQMYNGTNGFIALNKTPLPAVPTKSSANRKKLEQSPLRYPGKLTVDQKDGRTLYVSDSANHRVLAVDVASGSVLHVYGSGRPGLVDCVGTDGNNSNSEEAEFHSPQGVTLSAAGNVLFVADTESHAVRAIAVTSGAVSTIGGDGQQGFDYMGGKVGTAQRLSSPWDVEVVGNTLYVAMAGTHQIWCADVSNVTASSVAAGAGQQSSSGRISTKWEVFSGSGRELEKNSSVGRTAAWAQPSHLSMDGTITTSSPSDTASTSGSGLLYVADSESSSVRAIDVFGARHGTRTVVGGDGLLPENLFAFGDRPGRGSQARFQHPLAVCVGRTTKVRNSNTGGNGGDSDADNVVVYVADSYNHRIKTVDASGLASDFVGGGRGGLGSGNGTPGFKDGKGSDALFWEPAGLALSPDGQTLYVADTNNFAVRAVDTTTGSVTTLNISIPEGSSSSSTMAANTKNSSSFAPLIANRRRTTVIDCDPVKYNTNGNNSKDISINVTVTVTLPEQSHFTPGTTSRFQVNAVDTSGDSPGDKAKKRAKVTDGVVIQTAEKGPGVFSADVSPQTQTALSMLEIETVTYYCTEVDDVCRMDSAVFNVPLVAGADGQSQTNNKATLTHSIVPRKSASARTPPSSGA